VFSSNTFVGDDIYFMDNISAEKYQMIEKEKVNPTV
jgi:hypothetical protein